MVFDSVDYVFVTYLYFYSCSRYDLTVSPFCALSQGFTYYDPSPALNLQYLTILLHVDEPSWPVALLAMPGTNKSETGRCMDLLILDGFIR